MIDVQLEAGGVAQTFRILRSIDPESVKELRKELRSEMKPLAKAIAARYPSEPSLSGFEQLYGRWGWGKVTGSVKVTPGKARKGAGRNALVSISMNYKTATPFVLDMIGRHPDKLGNYPSKRYVSGYYGQGLALYNAIQAKFPSWPNGGRIFYKPFIEGKAEAYKSAEAVINRWSKKVSEELA